MGEKNSSFISDRIVLRIPMWNFALAVLALPSLSLAICFFTAYFFRFDEVNISMCDVQNHIPSISAVTGITPQAYLWRLGIALHSCPRLCVSFVHYNNYVQRLTSVPQARRALYMALVRVNFWLSLIENSMLVCVTFISNRENYPVHEKLFIVFMVTSSLYMLVNTLLFSMVCHTPKTEDEERSYFWKKVLFVVKMAATVGLVYFYMRHRLYCEPGAFSMFSLCEYIIAYAAMAYHFTAYLEFKDMYWLVASPVLRHGGQGGANNSSNNVGHPAAEPSNGHPPSYASEGISAALSHNACPPPSFNGISAEGTALRSRKL